MNEQIVSRPLTSKSLYVGIVDQAINGSTLIDYKTTSDIDAFRQTAIISPQLGLYAMGLAELGVPIQQASYRLVIKPTIRPKKNEPRLRRKKDETEEDFAARFEEAKANCQPQTAEEYEEECLQWLRSHEKPIEEITFHGIDGMIESAKSWIERTAEEIERAYESFQIEIKPDVRAFPTNHSACRNFNSACPYISLCSSGVLADAISDQDVINSNPHLELKQSHSELYSKLPLMNPQRDIITYSSASTYRQCPRKYYWRYIREFDFSERGETLAIGSMFHAAREAYGKTGSVKAGIEAINNMISDIPTIGDAGLAANYIGAKVAAMFRLSAERWPETTGAVTNAIQELHQLISDAEIVAALAQNGNAKSVEEFSVMAQSLLGRLRSLKRQTPIVTAKTNVPVEPAKVEAPDPFALIEEALIIEEPKQVSPVTAPAPPPEREAAVDPSPVPVPPTEPASTPQHIPEEIELMRLARQKSEQCLALVKRRIANAIKDYDAFVFDSIPDVARGKVAEEIVQLIIGYKG